MTFLVVSKENATFSRFSSDKKVVRLFILKPYTKLQISVNNLRFAFVNYSSFELAGYLGEEVLLLTIININVFFSVI